MDNTLIGLVIGLAFVAPVFGLIVWARQTARLPEVEKEGHPPRAEHRHP